MWRRPERRHKVRAIDEPEAHLHPGSVRQIAQGLERFATGGDVVLVTHHPYLIDQPGWEHVQLRRTHAGIRARKYGVNQRYGIADVAAELGVTSIELMSTLAGVLFVEGEHDRLILEAVMSQEFRAAGVKVSSLRGIFNLQHLPELELVADVLGELHVALMVDNAPRLGRDTMEAKYLSNFLEEMTKQGRPVTAIGLREPDIIAYLNEQAVEALNPGFPGWKTVVDEYRRINGTDFKGWLYRSYRVDLRYTNSIEKVLDVMARDSLPLRPGIVEQVKSFCAQCIASIS